MQLLRFLFGTPISVGMTQTETEFRAWRRRLRLTQDKAADALGRSRRQVQSYDGGDEDPPRVVALAMVALEDHPEMIAHGG